MKRGWSVGLAGTELRRPFGELESQDLRPLGRLQALDEPLPAWDARGNCHACACQFPAPLDATYPYATR